MFGLGFSEIILLGVLALIVIGPKQLPEVARTLGRFLNELKRATDDFKDDFKRQARADLDFKSISEDIQKDLNFKMPSQEEKLNSVQSPVAPIENNQDEYIKHIGGGHHHEEEKQLSLNLDVDSTHETKKTEGN